MKHIEHIESYNLPNYSEWLENRYNSPFCALDFHLNEQYVAVFDGDNLEDLVPYTLNRSCAVINNALWSIDDANISAISNYIFVHHPKVRRIQWSKLLEQNSAEEHPFIMTMESNDHVLLLPQTIEEYEASLSPHMRRHTKNYISRLNRTFPQYESGVSYKFIANNGTKIQGGVIRNIVTFNQLRMAGKNIVSGLDDEWVNNILPILHNMGVVYSLEVDGKLVAGLITYHIKHTMFVEAIASDPEYNKYDVGHICMYLTICDGIKNGIKEIHLLWGSNPYKSRFLANEIPLYSTIVFRNICEKNMYIFQRLVRRLSNFRALWSDFKRMVRNMVGESGVEKVQNIKKQIKTWSKE